MLVVKVKTQIGKRKFRIDREFLYLYIISNSSEKRISSLALKDSYASQQNGVADRINCTLLDMVRSMIPHADLSIKF